MVTTTETTASPIKVGPFEFEVPTLLAVRLMTTYDPVSGFDQIAGVLAIMKNGRNAELLMRASKEGVEAVFREEMNDILFELDGLSFRAIVKDCEEMFRNLGAKEEAAGN